MQEDQCNPLGRGGGSSPVARLHHADILFPQRLSATAGGDAMVYQEGKEAGVSSELKGPEWSQETSHAFLARVDEELGVRVVFFHCSDEVRLRSSKKGYLGSTLT